MNDRGEQSQSSQPGLCSGLPPELGKTQILKSLLQIQDGV